MDCYLSHLYLWMQLIYLLRKNLFHFLFFFHHWCIDCYLSNLHLWMLLICLLRKNLFHFSFFFHHWLHLLPCRLIATLCGYIAKLSTWFFACRWRYFDIVDITSIQYNMEAHHDAKKITIVQTVVILICFLSILVHTPPNHLSFLLWLNQSILIRFVLLPIVKININQFIVAPMM